MNKRQRKKQFKKRMQNYISGIDLGNGKDYTVLLDTTERFLYNRLYIPKEYMEERTRSVPLQYKEFLKINRKIIKGGD